MQNYKLFDVLKILNKKEFKLLGEFVNSPYFNKSIRVITLYNLLAKYYPLFKNRNLTIEKLFSGIYHGEKYDYHKINNVISDLYQVTENFIIQQHQENDSDSRDMALITGLSRINRLYEQKYNKRLNHLNTSGLKDDHYLYNMYLLNENYLRYITPLKPLSDLKLIQKMHDNFLDHAVIKLIKIYNLMLHETAQSRITFDLKWKDEILNYIDKSDPGSNPALFIFGSIFRLLLTQDIKYYNELKELKKKYLLSLKFPDQLALYTHMYDFAAYMVNFKGDDSFNRDMFEIFTEQIELKIMTKENFLYPNFMNVVKIACRVGEYNYAEKFIKEFEVSIPPAEKTNVLSFCHGVIENAKGNLKGALKYFSKSNFQNFIFKVQVKIMLLVIYYKLGMYEQALGIIDTFRHFLRNEENLLPGQSRSYNIFLKLMSDLVKLKESSNESDKVYQLKKLYLEAQQIPLNPFRIRKLLFEEIENFK
ncbi:MAG: hypothetical protein ABI543_09435 [Ignavibacteria bacterium]